MNLDSGNHGLPVSIGTPRSPDVTVLAFPRLELAKRERIIVPAGLTVADIVASAMPAMQRLDSLKVIVGDYIVPRELWPRVRPKPGTIVVLRLLPEGDNLRSALGLVVLVASAVAGGLAAPLLAGPLTGLGLSAATASSVATAIGTAGFAFAGTALLNAFVPVRTDQAATDNTAVSPTYSISGFQNVVNMNGMIPNVLGKHRIAPPYAAMPYSNIDLNNQYITALFLLGYGPLLIENIRLGETPLANYTGYSIETLQGFVTDPVQSFYPIVVFEEAPALEFPSGVPTAAPQVRTTASDVTAFGVDITFPRGLGVFTDTGSINNRNVQILLRYKLSTDTTWTTWGTISITAASRDPVRHSQLVGTLPAGQYDVEITRNSSTSTDFHVVEDFSWTALRGYRSEFPIQVESTLPMAMIGLVIRASDQLNGMIDNLNCDVTRICLDWDRDLQDWVEQPTQNPASLYRYVLQGNANRYPLLDSQIDLVALQDWHEFCDDNGLTYNRVHDFQSSIGQVLADIAAAGRATPCNCGTQWSVIIDRPQGVITGHITPRNSWGFSGERNYIKFPDAFRVSFIDQNNGYQDAERIVPFPDFVGGVEDVETTEEIQLPGVTDADLVFTEARRRQIEAVSRADRYTVQMDYENLIYTRGDLAQLSHDVLDRTQFAGRVKNVIGNVVVIDTVVEFETDENYACRFRASDGDSMLRLITHITVGDEASALHLEPGTMPEVGDLALFGRASTESRTVIVTAIEAMDDLTARLTLVDSAEDATAFPVPPVEPEEPGEDVLHAGAAGGIGAANAIGSIIQAGAGQASGRAILDENGAPILDESANIIYDQTPGGQGAASAVGTTV